MGLDGHVMIIQVACYRQESSIKILPSLPEWSLIHTSSTPTHPTPPLLSQPKPSCSQKSVQWCHCSSHPCFITWDFNGPVSSWPCSPSSSPQSPLSFICMEVRSAWWARRCLRPKGGVGIMKRWTLGIERALCFHAFHSSCTIIIMLSSPHSQATPPPTIASLWFLNIMFLFNQHRHHGLLWLLNHLSSFVWPPCLGFAFHQNLWQTLYDLILISLLVCIVLRGHVMCLIGKLATSTHCPS